ncbi:MAG: 4-hydroxy-tetrahydrodipicolinate reductase [Promethearchaeota archaeon]
MIKLLIFGPTGSMGRLVSALALEDEEIKVVAACDVAEIGKDLGAIVGKSNPNQIKISDVKNLKEIIKATEPDVMVDFTIASATENNSKICLNHQVRCVIGTTGLSGEFLKELDVLVKKNQSPCVLSSNMATGTNIFFKMASLLATYLLDWDIEIIEAHHHRKVDAPSGTALTVGKLISEALNVNFNDVAKFGRDKGPNKRKIGAKQEIGIHSIRAGDIVGDHVVLFAGPGERIELKHQAHSRNCFATGAIKAIKFIKNAAESKIYSMNEVLGL